MPCDPRASPSRGDLLRLNNGPAPDRDTVYPGRLHVEDWAAFTRSIDRLLGFCAERPVTHVVGCHIEMTTQPGVDYPIRTTYQPDEPPLQMTVSQLRAVRTAIDSVGDHQGWHTFPDFLLYRPAL